MLSGEWPELAAVNRWVVGSSPTRGANHFKGLAVQSLEIRRGDRLCSHGPLACSPPTEHTAVPRPWAPAGGRTARHWRGRPGCDDCRATEPGSSSLPSRSRSPKWQGRTKPLNARRQQELPWPTLSLRSTAAVNVKRQDVRNAREPSHAGKGPACTAAWQQYFV
jgi:hypothetical protein